MARSTPRRPMPIDAVPFDREKEKYKFFKMLEKSVYEGDDAKEFRELYKLPIPAQTVKVPTSPVPQPRAIPYWELHYYHNGFNAFSLGGAALWFDNEKDNEQHFYFTLRSLITDEHYKDLNKQGLIFKSTASYRGVEVITNVGFSNCKVDRYYTGNPKDQTAGGIDILILEDKDDNFKSIQQWMPLEIWDCLTKKGGSIIPGYKPSELPQMMFIAHGSTFMAKTENVNSIVCLDRFTQLATNESNSQEPVFVAGQEQLNPDQTLKIKGNLFLNEGAMVMPGRYGKKDEIDLFVGGNVVFGYDSAVHAAIINGNVFIGDNVNIDTSAIIREDCILAKGVKVTEKQKILSCQRITARPPLFLDIMKDEKGMELDMFYLHARSRRGSLLDGMLPGFQDFKI